MTVFGCDFGGSVFHVCKEGKKETHEKFDVDTFIELPFAKRGDVVLVELAHLQPQKEEQNSSISLSQGLSYEKLIKLEQNLLRKEVLLKVVPHSLTPRLRAEFFPGEQKNDDVDAAAVYYFWAFYGEAGLQNFKPHKPNSFSEKLELSFAIKKEMDCVLNWFRAHKGNKKKISEVPMLKLYIKHIEKTIDYHCLFGGGFKHSADQNTERWLFGRKEDSKHLTPPEENSILCSLWASVFDYDGNLRLHPNTGEPLGINFIWKNVFASKPNHFRGGVGRSNLYNYGFKIRVLPEHLRYDELLPNGDKKKIPLNPDNVKRQELNKLRRQYAQVCKSMLRKMQQLDLQDNGPTAAEIQENKLIESQRLREIRDGAKRLRQAYVPETKANIVFEQGVLL